MSIMLADSIIFGDNSVLNSSPFGFSNYWRDVTASRASGTAYVNGLNYPKQILLYMGGTTYSIAVNGITLASFAYTARTVISFYVASGATYSIVSSGAPIGWYELY